MKILIGENNPHHLQAALEQLQGHELITATSFVETADHLKGMKDSGVKNFTYTDLGVLKVDFDAALLDLMMPEEETKAYQQSRVNPLKEWPYGLVLALRAIQCGVKYVGVITDTNHHVDAYSAALDLICPADWDRRKESDDYQPTFTLGESRLIIAHAPMVQGNPPVKEWSRLLAKLTDQPYPDDPTIGRVRTS